ncbi:peptidoglycan-binding protein [Streptomyces sp. NPDC059443]|uniref:peptidoglycan-binding protein n=1 Tax=unclassified Streptomyces TaxID=2593676 RepID=UPI00369B8558
MRNTPRFIDLSPHPDCPCTGCRTQRTERRQRREGCESVPLVLGTRTAAVLVAAAGVGLSGVGPASAADSASTPTAVNSRQDSKGADPHTPQGRVAGLQGAPEESSATSARRSITRAEVIRRARGWVDQKVPYHMGKYWSDGYRQDCSGFVSMAWNLGSSQTTWTLPDFATRLSKSQLSPGDILVRNNPDSPASGSHVVIFGGWTDSSRTRYVAYEQTRPHTLKRDTPYAYWNHSGSYVAYRYDGITGGNGEGRQGEQDAFPGAGSFGPGARNEHVTRLGKMLTVRGAGRFYTSGPGPRWSAADRDATAAFQRAQGWTGADADGIPGKTTWDNLIHGKGRDIPSTPKDQEQDRTPGGGSRKPAFPGTGHFRPGRVNDHVLDLGRQLVRKGFGRYYAVGPSRDWGEPDRHNVAAFQRAQGWTGADADGYPGPQTWSRLFS